MSSDPHNSPRRDDVDPPEDATARIDPVPPESAPPESAPPESAPPESAPPSPVPPSPDSAGAAEHESDGQTAPAPGSESGTPGEPGTQPGVESYSAGWPVSPSGHASSQRDPYGQGGYSQREQGQGEYSEGHYTQGQYGQGPYGQHSSGHGRPDQAQPGEGHYTQGQYGSDPHGAPYGAQYAAQHAAQSGQGEHGHGEYTQGQYGQQGHSPYNQDPAYSGQGYDSYGGYGSGAAFGPGPQQQPRAKRTVGVGGLALAVLLAGLLGGGVVAGSQAVLDDGAISTSSTGGIEINNPDSATVVTAAAAKASPSVVTLAVSDGGQGGSGSGIILDGEGHVLTNTHVVTLGGAAADPDIQVRMSDGSVSNAEIVGTDPLSDLAVIRLENTEGIQPAELGSSGDLNVGDQSIAIGAPLGLAGTVTDGIVSTLNRTISVASSAVEDDGADAPEAPEEGEEGDGFEFYFPDMEGSPTQGSIHLNVIQTDAAINRGNSGGALVDSEGRVIGVNVAIASSGGAAETDAGSIGVGFAVPIDYAQRVAQELIETGEVSHGLLGVTVAAAGSQEIPEETEPGLAPVMPGFTVGALIDDVPDNTPAAEAGLANGDIITAVNDRRIEDSLALTATIREYAAGETVTISYLRDGQQEEAEVTLGAT